MLLGALVAVATSPPMSDYQRYVQAVCSRPKRDLQPDAGALLGALAAWSGRFKRALPEHLSARRLAAALVSFVDDYTGPYPEEAFDDRAVRIGLDRIAASDLPMTIPDLLDGEPFSSLPTRLDALLVGHAVLRQLARGRDDRALPSARMSLEERLRIGGNIVPFHPSLSWGGDPLGDAYHYLANVTIGTLFAARRMPHSARVLWPIPLFAVGPELMTLVRERTFGSKLFFGNHARIDRMGLRHGLSLGGLPCV